MPHARRPVLGLFLALSTRTAFIAVAMIAIAFVSADAGGTTDIAKIDLTQWKPPDIEQINGDAFGRLVQYGHALFTTTANQIGPTVADPARRYAGNNLDCQSCHLKAGTQPYAMPLAGVWGQFPQYRAREGEVGTLEDRINGCLARSMNGRTLPLASREMKAYLAFMRWLSTGVPDGAKLTGAGTLAIKEPGRAADLDRGKQIYARVCTTCHGPDGGGQRAATGAGYQYPPLWGPDSFNDAAGMGRLLKAAAFIKNNMPFGTTFAAPELSDDDAYDVAGFVISQQRPHKADLAKDYPNRLQKPVDTPYGPYADGFNPIQHKLGPFGPIRTKLKELAAQSDPRH